jgi:hypothetical protein
MMPPVIVVSLRLWRTDGQLDIRLFWFRGTVNRPLSKAY